MGAFREFVYHVHSAPRTASACDALDLRELVMRILKFAEHPFQYFYRNPLWRFSFRGHSVCSLRFHSLAFGIRCYVPVIPWFGIRNLAGFDDIADRIRNLLKLTFLLFGSKLMPAWTNISDQYSGV